MNDTFLATAPPFKDRYIGLVLLGVFELLIGILCFLMVPMMILGFLISKTAHVAGMPAMTNGMIASSAVLYCGLGVLFVCIGVGSIKARRWARGLMLMIAWFWLVSGIVSLFLVVVILPDMYATIAEVQKMPAEIMRFMRWLTVAITAVLYVFIPGAFVLFYGSRHVKATCEWRDPSVRWTDRCPLPVLAVSLLCAFAALCMALMMGCYGWTFPFFGVVLNGVPGAACILPTAAVLGYVAWGMYRLKIAAWWGLIHAGSIAELHEF